VGATGVGSPAGRGGGIGDGSGVAAGGGGGGGGGAGGGGGGRGRGAGLRRVRRGCSGRGGREWERECGGGFLVEETRE
jgi:hypothetical protein